VDSEFGCGGNCEHQNTLSESLRRDCTSPLAGDASSCSSICIYTAFTAIRDVPKQHLYSRLRDES
jgi:hypothetical protein